MTRRTLCRAWDAGYTVIIVVSAAQIGIAFVLGYDSLGQLWFGP